MNLMSQKKNHGQIKQFVNAMEWDLVQYAKNNIREINLIKKNMVKKLVKK